jgi:diguanylate cyclase (GGDEF)-like protein
VLFVDLDKLKDVNDTIGHDVGDQLLSAVSRRLVSAVRPADLVARIGGDEFVVLCEGVTDEHVAYDVAERVRTAMTGQVIVRGIELFTTASIGVALATTGDEIEESPADEAVTLLRNADTAMYRAKQRGRGRSELFSEKMRSDARERRALTADLERALAAGQLRLLYQPVRAAQGGRLTGAEVLLRWEHPVRGTLAPPDFLPLAIESGAIGPIGDWVVRTACGVVRGWIDSGAVERTFALHVNLAERELADPTLVERVSAALRDAGLDAANLVVEVTESTMLADSPAVSRSLTALRRHGVRVAIDDFGTGYSSLAHLRQFPADFLKLDGTLVRDLGGNGTDDPIVRSIIQLAHSLDLTVVAEWVTSDVHLERLRVLGCDLAQGNLLGPPVAAEAFTAATRETRVPRR